MLQKPATTVSDPTNEPLTLEEAKKHLEIASADDAHDSHVGDLIQYARQRFELDTGKLTTSRTVVEYYREFPTTFELFHRPVQSITNIKYYDGGSLSTVSSSTYSLDSDRRLVVLDDEDTWPSSVDDRWDAVQVTYVAGEADNAYQINAMHKHAMKLLIENAFDDRHKDSTSLLVAYENLIRPLMRPTYP